MAFTNFFGGAFFGGGFFGGPTGGGGGSRRYGPLPQYYSRKAIMDAKNIPLPQDEVSNRVAVQILDKAAAIWNRVESNDKRFGDMLSKIEAMQRQVAVYIESQQIYNVVAELKQCIQAKKDMDWAMKQEEDEEAELMELIDRI